MVEGTIEYKRSINTVSKSLAVIGGGVMAEAIVSRLLGSGIYAATEVVICEPNPQRRVYLAQEYGCGVMADNRAGAAAEIVLLAVKPQIFPDVAKELSQQAAEGTTIVSIMAGISLAQLGHAWPTAAIVRAMPNTPATVGAGMTALAANDRSSEEILQNVRNLFAAVGDVVTVPESLMDGVTGLSGSGPAFVAIFIEALADGGVAAGLPRPIAQKLALQTVLGTARLLAESEDHPAIVKDRVTSPGGTTIAGVAALESRGFRSAAIEAVKAATQRAKELNGD